jgi:fluoride exporter
MFKKLFKGAENMSMIAVGIGGFFGAILRYQMGTWIPAVGGFPVGTLTINLIGCFFLAWFLTITAKRLNIHPSLRLGIGTGFTGAFTTFSTFSVETVTLIANHQLALAMIYVLSSVVGGIILAVLGAKLAGIHPPDPVDPLEEESK